MKLKLLLAAAAVVVTLGVGSMIAWGASSQSAPAVWAHGTAKGTMESAAGMRAMHAGLDKADRDRMVKACQKLMKDSGMPKGMTDDDMMDADMMDGDMMDEDADMMGGDMTDEDADMMGGELRDEDADMMGGGMMSGTR
jgi:hypothetical protein